MNHADVQPKLNGIFRDIFDDDTLEIHPGMTAKDVDGWDSLTHVNLVVAVEKAFKVSFTTKEITGLNNVGDFLSLIARKAG